MKYLWVRVRGDRLLRRMLPGQTVVRSIQGVRLRLPRSHRLPEYAMLFPGYGQNLVDLAEVLAPAGRPLGFLDIGANVGDSTMQVLARVDARVLCVEADPYWLSYLESNVGGDHRIIIEPVMLTPESASAGVSMRRRGGTTQFVPSPGSVPIRVRSPRELRRAGRVPRPLDLVKSDTDGYDPAIVAAVAEQWCDETPTIFFEYDELLAAAAGNARPSDVWTGLARLGYETVCIWDNFGCAREMIGIDRVKALAARVSQSSKDHDYWDVAALHRDRQADVDRVYEWWSGLDARPF